MQPLSAILVSIERTTFPVPPTNSASGPLIQLDKTLIHDHLDKTLQVQPTNYASDPPDNLDKTPQVNLTDSITKQKITIGFECRESID